MSDALTSWRACTDRQGRMWKGSKWARARAGEHRQTDESGHRKNPSEQGALTDEAARVMKSADWNTVRE